jgi:4-hydroxy-4-methyl-2-oxoglutarate aldolase
VSGSDCAVGFRVFGRPAMPGDGELRELAGLQPANIADAMHGLGVVDHAISLRSGQPPLVGPALTVSLTPGDGMMLRMAIAVSRPGDVIVVNAGGLADRAVAGGNVIISMIAHGVAGLLVDGAVRDLAELRALPFPVYARSTTVRSGSTACGRGEVFGPIACGGVAVHPGDVVVADEDGAVVIPRRDVAVVTAAARRVEVRKGGRDDLEQRLEQVRQGGGGSFDLDAIIRDLAAAGCVNHAEPWSDVPVNLTVEDSAISQDPRG